ncbi:ADE_G0037860.mRNA.1.CDS.1 [Saccharomyces cerevisiae]|nr:Grx8p [Saccharomyces cerevisiae YJM1399]CAI4663498.1 ADE_G0037860.mRNA.1.CDS.1 [Saccharomyces cerevisiae]CAI6814401.1 ADE_G0037860.mRNA.1.CDS.1 [Saccharomyces cerevisiae]
MSAFVTKAEEMIKSHPYFQLSASWCPDCVFANSIWNKLNVQDKVFVFDIGSLPRNEQEKWRIAFQKVVGSRNLPTIVVNGKFWGTESQLHRFEAKGTLEEELTKIGLLP